MKNLFLLAVALVFSSSIFAQANKNNPFDYIGQRHNDLLAQWMRTCQGMGQDEWGGFYKEQFQENHLETLQEIMPVKALAEQGGSSFANHLMNNKNISRSVKSYYGQMRKALAHNDGTEAITERMIALESRIMKDKELSKGDREALLSGASVFRYSYAFWEDFILIWWPEMDFNPFGTGTDGWNKAAPIIEADATTAIAVGGTLAAGLATPPTGVAAGTVTAGSAAIASAAVGVVEVGKWVWDKIWN